VATWRVQLVGDVFDLEELPKLFAAEHLRVVEEQGAYYLQGSALDALDDAGQVREAANGILSNINGAARLDSPDYKPATLGLVQKIHSDGAPPDQFIELPTIVRRAKGYAPTVSIGGAPPEPPAPNPATNWLAIAQTSEPVQRVLGYLGQPEVSWAELYKVIDAVQENGGAHLIGTVVSQNVIDRITQTANSLEAIGEKARHGHNKTPAPKKPIQLSEVREAVHRLVRAWIDSKG
jgi:hypothetical protein